MSPWLILVLAGLGAMKLTEIIKEIVPWPLQPWVKSALSTVWAGVFAILGADTFRHWVMLAAGAAGLSALCHEIRDVLSARGDESKSTVIMRSASTGVSRRTRI